MRNNAEGILFNLKGEPFEIERAEINKLPIMNKVAQDAWCTELLTGGHKQCHGSLFQAPNLYDVLGVLCLAYHKKTGNGRFINARLTGLNDNWGGFEVEEGEWVAHVPPDMVLLWSGLKKFDGEWVKNGQEFVRTLLKRNDDDKWGFDRFGLYVGMVPV